MPTIDDKAAAIEELDRDLALKMRRPTGPASCGYCLNCELPLLGGARWCDDDCRDDWQARLGGMHGR